MSAVILRDIRSRFFNHGVGFLLVPLWPLAHMTVLLALYTAMGRKVPYGEDLATFFATGLLPTLTFNYVSRFMAMSVLQNKSMTAFPVVTIVDIMTARAFLEIISAASTLLLAIIFLSAYGADPLPEDPYEAIFAYLSLIILAVGVGSLVSVIVMMFKFFMTAYTLVIICLYISSGTVFVTSSLPDRLQYILSFNPVLQIVEWVRSSYYIGYGTVYLDKMYPIEFGLTALAIGLGLERMLRMLIMDN